MYLRVRDFQHSSWLSGAHSGVGSNELQGTQALIFAAMVHYGSEITTLELVMKKVTSTHANRSFSRILADAIKGQTTEITVRGKVVAKIGPAEEAGRLNDVRRKKR